MKFPVGYEITVFIRLEFDFFPKNVKLKKKKKKMVITVFDTERHFDVHVGKVEIYLATRHR